MIDAVSISNITLYRCPSSPNNPSSSPTISKNPIIVSIFVGFAVGYCVVAPVGDTNNPISLPLTVVLGVVRAPLSVVIAVGVDSLIKTSNKSFFIS